MAKVRVGLVGCGFVAELHIYAYKRVYGSMRDAYRGSRLLVVGDRLKRLAADAPIDPAPDEQPEQPDEQCDPVEVNFVGNDCIILKPNVLKTKLPGLERYCDLRVFVPMSSDRIIVDAIKVAQNLLNQNLPPAHNLTDAATVLRFRELVRSQAIRSVLERSSDTLFAFALRAVERVTSDHSQTNRETINRLWEVLDDPYLNQALGNPHNRRQMLGPPSRH